jgi:type I restriction enzyme S subunit
MEHKISKFQWFNEIPSHWKESKISYLFEIGRGRVISGPELKEDGLYPVYSSQTKNDGCMGMIDTYDFDDDLITWTTDGANAGTVFIRSGKFNCTNVCGTLKPVVDADLKYYYYYLQFVTQFYKRPDTNGAKIMNNEMASVHALIPPLSEQTKIAAFLDRKTAQIDTIIEKKQKLLQLLDEKKKAVINEAVTGQKVWVGNAWVEPAEVKDSGVEWVGEIPANWELKKMKYLLADNGIKIGPFGSALKLDTLVESGIKIYGQSNVIKDDFDLGHRYIDAERFTNDFQQYEIMNGDLLLTMMGTTGKAKVFQENF